MGSVFAGVDPEGFLRFLEIGQAIKNIFCIGTNI